MKLNGWQRIGIIASIAWAVPVYFYQMNQSTQLASRLAGSEYADCLGEEARKNLPQSDSCSTLRSERWKRYSEGSKANAAIAALVPIPVAWVLIYIAIWIIRWIRAGFKNA